MGDMAKSHGKEVSITEALTKELMDHYGVIDSPLHFTDKKLIH